MSPRPTSQHRTFTPSHPNVSDAAEKRRVRVVAFLGSTAQGIRNDLGNHAFPSISMTLLGNDRNFGTSPLGVPGRRAEQFSHDVLVDGASIDRDGKPLGSVEHKPAPLVQRDRPIVVSHHAQLDPGEIKIASPTLESSQQRRSNPFASAGFFESHRDTGSDRLTLRSQTNPTSRQQALRESTDQNHRR